MTHATEDTKAVWTRIRVRRAVISAVERRKPKETREDVTWQRVYDAFTYKGKKLPPDEFRSIVAKHSGQDVPVITAGGET